MKNQKILIIDDDPYACQTLSSILRAKGFSPFSVGAGKEAVKAVAECFFHIALIDLQLPDLAGIKVLTEIKKLSPDTEAIIITGHASLDTAVQAMEDAAFSYVVKPIDIDYLLALMNKALERQKLRMDHRMAEEKLKEYRDHLEELVRARTVQLTTANEQLQSEITERKRSEELLRESEEKYSTLVEQAMDGVVVIQEEVYKFANQAMAEMTGYAIKKLVGKSIAHIIAPEYRERVVHICGSFLRGEKIATFFEWKILDKNGVIKDCEVTCRVIKYNGKPAVIGIIRDVTQRKVIIQTPLPNPLPKRERELKW